MSTTDLLKKVPRRQADGFYDGTYLCKAIGKPLGNWHRAKSTQALIRMIEDGANPPNPIHLGKSIGVLSHHTWVCEELALDILRWGRVDHRSMMAKLEEMDERRKNIRQSSASIPKLELPAVVNSPEEAFDPRFPNTPKDGITIQMNDRQGQQFDRQLYGDRVYESRMRRVFERSFADWDADTGFCGWRKPTKGCKWKRAHVEFTGGLVPYKVVQGDEGIFERVDFPEPVIEYSK